VSTPVDTVVFTASRLRGNSIGGYSDDHFVDLDKLISTPEGITALGEGLKGSSVTSLECAAAPSVRFYVNAH
jgi:hypothetical protein